MKKVSSPETDTGHLLIEHTNKTVETMEACFSFKEKKSIWDFVYHNFNYITCNSNFISPSMTLYLILNLNYVVTTAKPVLQHHNLQAFNL